MEYENEAERKKVEYIANQWTQSTSRPKGYVIFVSDRDFHEIYQSIAAKFPEERIQSYELVEKKPEVKSVSRRITVAFRENQKQDQIWAFINYLVNRRRGALTSSLGKVFSYRIMTRKASVDLDVTLISIQPVSLVMEIRGPEDGVALIEKEFSQELEIFGGKVNE